MAGSFLLILETRCAGINPYVFSPLLLLGNVVYIPYTWLAGVIVPHTSSGWVIPGVLVNGFGCPALCIMIKKLALVMNLFYQHIGVSLCLQ